MSKFSELKEEAVKLGIKIPFGASASKIEGLIEEVKGKDDKLTPPVSSPKDEEDDGEKLSAPKRPEANTAEDLRGYDAPPGVAKNDYLWRYEIDENTGYPHFKARTVPFDPPWQYRQPARGRQREQKERMLGEPRMTYIIPKPDGEKGDIYQSATINGYRLDIPKNEVVELPKSIVELLMTSFRQTQKALNTGLYKDAKGTRI